MKKIQSVQQTEKHKDEIIDKQLKVPGETWNKLYKWAGFVWTFLKIRTTNTWIWVFVLVLH